MADVAEDDACSLAISLGRKRRGATTLGGSPAALPQSARNRSANTKATTVTAATEWLDSSARDNSDKLVITLRGLPPSVLLKVRLFDVGHGSRIRSCLLCGSWSHSYDPILGERVMLLWGHLDTSDGVTILGMIDWYCVGVMRRRWAGWKLSELVALYKAKPEERAKHCRWRDQDIDFIRKSGLGTAVTAHCYDGGVDTSKSKRSARSKHEMVETFHMGQDALWPSQVFAERFNMSAAEAGYEELSYPLPDGSVLKGVRLPHDPKEMPVTPVGVVLISKDYKIAVGMQQQLNQNAEDEDGSQLNSAMMAMSKRHVNVTSSSDSAIPLVALVERAKRQRSRSDAGACVAAGAFPTEMELDDAPGSMFERASFAMGGLAATSRAPPAASPAPAGVTEALPFQAAGATAAQGSTSLESALAALKETGASGAGADGGDPASLAAAARRPKRRLAQKCSEAAAAAPLWALPPAPAPPPALALSPTTCSGRRGGGAGGIGAASGGKVARIREEIEKQYEESTDPLTAVADDAAIVQVEGSLSGYCTLWGKKRGALLSSSRVDDAEVVQNLISTAQALRAALSSYKKFKESRTLPLANSFIGHFKALPDTMEIPVVVRLEAASAKAHIEITAGNLTAAVKAIGLTTLAPDGDTDGTTQAHELQSALLKRHYTEMLRSCDEKGCRVENFMAEVANFTKGLLDANSMHDLSQEIEQELEHLMCVLRPESSRIPDLDGALEHLKRSELLKAFRVFDSGRAITIVGERSREALENCRADVSAYTEWVKQCSFIITLGSSASSSPDAFSQLLDLFKTSTEGLSNIVVKCRNDLLVGRCTVAETGDDFAGMNSKHVAMVAAVQMAVVGRTLRGLLSCVPKASEGISSPFGSLPTTFSAEVAGQWKADVNKLMSDGEARFKEVEQSSLSDMWSFDVKVAQVSKEGGVVLMNLVWKYVQDFQAALIAFCDLRVKVRDKLQVSHEFKRLADLLNNIDSGEFPWTSSPSSGLLYVNSLFTNDDVQKDLRGCFKVMRFALTKAAEAEWVACASELLPISEHYSAPWKVLAEMTGVKGCEHFLPLNFQALPSSHIGKHAVADLTNTCSQVSDVLKQSLNVAIVKGRAQHSMLCSWMHLCQLRATCCQFITVLLAIGVNPGESPSTWLAAVKQPFAAVMKAYTAYDCFHATKSLPESDATLLKVDRSAPTWGSFEALHKAAGTFMQQVTSHVFGTLQDVRDKVESRAKACYHQVDQADWKGPMLKTPSAEKLKNIVLQQDTNGMDLIDASVSILQDWQSLWEVTGYLGDEGIVLPTRVVQDSLRPGLDEAKYFLCVCSAWDIMLGDPPETKKQRKADVEQFQKTVAGNCTGIFPSSLMELLHQWADGKDIGQALP